MFQPSGTVRGVKSVSGVVEVSKVDAFGVPLAREKGKRVPAGVP